MNYYWPTMLALLISNCCYAQQDFSATIESIPAPVAAAMHNHSWHQGCPLPLSDLSYLSLTYWGFDNQPHQGHLVVLKILAGETVQIFQELYQIKFPIEKMLLPEEYAEQKNDWQSIDWRSAKDNNSAGFLCRPDDQNSKQFSSHSYGIALDINPVYNPARVENNKIEPENGALYFNRKLHHLGMINPAVVAIFAKYGWHWGGYWSEDKIDYQHFEKEINRHYMCPTLIPVPNNL